MAKLLTLLFEVTGLFDMRTRPELMLLQKTMVVVEGVARSLDPEARHVEDRPNRSCATGSRAISGPTGGSKSAAQGVGDNRPVSRRSAGPARARGRVSIEQLDAITRDGLVLSPQSVDAIARAQAENQRWKTAGLWMIALMLFWIAWMLWT